jgi:LPXTG-site transpeptidase (sortase) family protein
MKSKLSLKWSLFVTVIVGIALVSIFFLIQAFYLSDQVSYATRTSIPKNWIRQKLIESIPFPKQINPGLPIRINIPAINVDAPVWSGGINSDGAMVSPNGPDDTVWYNLGPRPGEAGSAVMAGHYGNWKNGKGSVFDNLSKLKKGDSIFVKDEKGRIAIFIVREIRMYSSDADASDVFVSNDGKAHLNLITCDGVWDKTSKSYSKRLVVFTDKK